jgi:hypothetical protein
VTTVKYSDLEEAYAFVSFAPPMANAAYIARDTGIIYCTSDFTPLDEEVPEDLEISDRYVVIPHKNDLDLGRNLALRFAEEQLGDQAERVDDIFRHKGAYARFKDLLESKGLVEEWYSFEAQATEAALRDWCAENGIEVSQQSG